MRGSSGSKNISSGGPCSSSTPSLRKHTRCETSRAWDILLVVAEGPCYLPRPCWAAWAQTSVQFAMLTFLPLLSQDAVPGLNSGFVVIPLTVLWMTLGAFTGMLALRIGTRPLALVAVILAIGASVAVAASTAYPSLLLASVLVGTSAGLILIPALLLSQHAAPHGDVGAATSFMVLMRNFGGAAGAAIVAVLLEGGGATLAFGVVAVVAATAILPALLLPSPDSERRTLAANEAGRGSGSL